ncbi:hypothetical protein GCM10007860_33130 [Chitiniphilus shinanonensis]|uniref:N-acetyltransferase domain-containing protein n=1 Tax=Chitiniphilus shinanonensis TaxID=553088 RepID=A0ABQ6BVZ4_9NEIS|nr:GNAT family N-acetyltransferase [Chitiniphilus shinanonensis]GLS06145.1 hypothetical protein GCM10007860_33130 [Chitiniphilus shinanonensis]
MLLRKIDWQRDHAALLDFDAGYSTERIYRVDSDGLGFALREQALSQPFRKCYDLEELADDVVDADCAWLVESPAGGIDGFVTAHYEAWNRSMELTGLFVRPARRRQGLGRLLLDKVADVALGTPARQLWLETQNTNLPGIRFYLAQGFAVCGLDTSLYDPNEVMEGEVAVFMARPLG